MKLLISSPCAYGLATVPFVQSLLSSFAQLRDDGIETTVKMLGTESLINRARNTDATYMLHEGFDKILFIDADMVFTYESVKLLLGSDKKIVGGTYPVKNFPITLNFNPLDEQTDLYGTDRSEENYLEWKKQYADPKTGEAEVAHVPTGFLMVDRSVFVDLTFKVPWYRLFMADTKKTSVQYDFFPTSVVDHELLSEDWGFCHTARKHGHKVYLQTKVINGHVGTFTYRNQIGS